MQMMAGIRFTPVVIGVGDIKNRSTKVEDAIEPMLLMLQATRRAIEDTNLSPTIAKKLQSDIDCVSVVATWTWNYHDLPGLLAVRLGVEPTYKVLSNHGGNSPAKLFDEAARRISFGKSKVAIVTGGEALASCEYAPQSRKIKSADTRVVGACAAAGKLPPPGWTAPDESAQVVSLKKVTRHGDSTPSAKLDVAIAATMSSNDKSIDLGTNHSIGLPIHVYPLFENGFRAHRNQSIEANNAESAKLYADFAKVAEQNPLSWNHGQPAATEDQIRTVTKKNRMICFPCAFRWP